MKKILTIFMMVISMPIFAQNYPITGINITLPSNPDANTANWGSGVSLLTISASTKPQNGRVDGSVMESKLLVTIRRGGRLPADPLQASRHLLQISMLLPKYGAAPMLYPFLEKSAYWHQVIMKYVFSFLAMDLKVSPR